MHPDPKELLAQADEYERLARHYSKTASELRSLARALGGNSERGACDHDSSSDSTSSSRASRGQYQRELKQFFLANGNQPATQGEIHRKTKIPFPNIQHWILKHPWLSKQQGDSTVYWLEPHEFEELKRLAK